MKKLSVQIILFTVFILLLFGLLNQLQHTDIVTVEAKNGVADLRGYDLSTATVRIFTNSVLYYDNALLTPEDLARPDAPVPTYERDESVQYGTHVLTLLLPAGETYGVTGFSTEYAQTLYINGKITDRSGVPGDTEASTVPSTKYYTCFFTPEDGQTQLVYQYANFNHTSGGGSQTLYVSDSPNILSLNQKNMFAVCLIVGCLLTVFIFYTGMYLFGGRKSAFLYFALTCLLIAARAMTVEIKTIMVLLPGLNWYFTMAAEYLVTNLSVVCFTAFVNRMIPGLIHKKILWCFYGMSCIYTISVLLLRPLVYSGFLPYYLGMVLLFGVYVLARMIRNLKNKRPEDILLFVGILLFLVAGISDAHAISQFLAGYRLRGMMQSGMMAFIYINMVSLTLHFSRAERELAVSRQKEGELQAVNKLRNQLFSNISHDLKTPLSVLSANIELLRENHVAPEEAVRYLHNAGQKTAELTRLIQNLIDTAKLESELPESLYETVPLSGIMTEISDRYTADAETFGLSLSVSFDADCGVLIDRVRFWSVMDNIIGNAMRFTPKSGSINVNAQFIMHNSQLLISVKDTGCGIAAEHLPHVFERFYKADKSRGDKGSGIGLHIVKTFTESMGGRVEINSEVGKGTEVIISLKAQNTGDLS